MDEVLAWAGVAVVAVGVSYVALRWGSGPGREPGPDRVIERERAVAHSEQHYGGFGGFGGSGGE